MRPGSEASVGRHVAAPLGEDLRLCRTNPWVIFSIDHDTHCPGRLSARLFHDLVPVHESGVVSHDQMAVDLLNQIETDADHDQQPRSPQERGHGPVDPQRCLTSDGITATKARKAAPT